MTEDNPGVKLYTQQNHKYYRINKYINAKASSWRERRRGEKRGGGGGGGN